MDNPIPVNEANERKALLHELMEAVSEEAKAVFVDRLNELVYERHGSRDAAVLGIAVEDAEGTDLEWLQDHLTDKVSTEIDRLRVFVGGLIEERDEARAEVEHWKVSAKQHAENHTAAVEAFHDASRLRSIIQQARIKAESERDEARAEVERLREMLVRLNRIDSALAAHKDTP